MLIFKHISVQLRTCSLRNQNNHDHKITYSRLASHLSIDGDQATIEGGLLSRTPSLEHESRGTGLRIFTLTASPNSRIGLVTSASLE